MIVRYTCWDPLGFLYVKLYPRYQNHARESEVIIVVTITNLMLRDTT